MHKVQTLAFLEVYAILAFFLVLQAIGAIRASRLLRFTLPPQPSSVQEGMGKKGNAIALQ